ncbi:hypothetical protein [Microbacterium sp. AK031]|uniref:hypothetical protein n=1 Tax=Microbacterium sp. AK031 TaxID=2723076 RepID=UPI00216A80A3|nr:hypothetical protein [Microbacterium sp. AK031]MCS3844494.1 hypothetical protein [Microbacterium sp. AK031]
MLQPRHPLDQDRLQPLLSQQSGKGDACDTGADDENAQGIVALRIDLLMQGVAVSIGVLLR